MEKKTRKTIFAHQITSIEHLTGTKWIKKKAERVMKMLSFCIFTSEMNYEEESLILEAICFNVSQLHFFYLEKLVRKINAIKIPWNFFDFERRRTRTLWTLNADVNFFESNHKIHNYRRTTQAHSVSNVKTINQLNKLSKLSLSMFVEFQFIKHFFSVPSESITKELPQKPFSLSIIIGLHSARNGQYSSIY